MTKSVARLFKQFQPNHYDLTIDLDEKNMLFAGKVQISGRKVGRPSKRLTFHSNGLKITSAKITFSDKKCLKEITPDRIHLHKSYHEVRLHSDSMLYPGNYTVEMTFEAPVTKGMTGIYPCFFKSKDGDKTLFATQFESHHAREAFPCIDEPEAKATFDLTLTTNESIPTLSNTPIKEQSVDGSRQTTIFETTPKMSTYLLAFVTGEIHKISGKTKSGVEVNVWGTTAQPASAFDFALDTAIKSIEYFENYFGVPYPLKKCDHVGLPDFSSGAMENWGLITYRERVLFAYEGDTAQSTKEQIALVIAHETSHQWFGNLVTMRWWNDLWLNESFANMMEYQCIDSFFPEWNVWDSFIADEGLSAFRRDSLYGVQAVRSDVHHPDEISSLFDPSIVYAKGGRLLFMLKNYVGEDAFQTGLSTYFNQHAYGNTDGDDLWRALSKSSGKDIESFMNPWLTRAGFPVVHIEKNNSGITLKQSQFLEDQSKIDPTKIWPIPTFSNNSKIPDLFTSSHLEITNVSSGPLVLNQGSKGHYLINYADTALNDAVKQLVSAMKISVPDRLMLLNASAMFARTGIVSFGETLNLLQAYRNEISEPVWGIMSMIIGDARRYVDLDETLETPIKKYSGELAKTLIAKLGWENKPNESSAEIKLRAIVLGHGVYAEIPALRYEAEKRFNAYMNEAKELPAEIRALIFCVPIKYGDAKAFDFLLRLHDETQNSELKADACDALTATKNPDKALLLLERIKDQKIIKPQDADRWLVYLLRNRHTRSVAWQWMVDNWQWLEDTFKNDKSYDYLPRYAATCVNTTEYQKKYDELFLDKLNQPLLKRNIELGRAEIATRVEWLERDLSVVQKFFK